MKYVCRRGLAGLATMLLVSFLTFAAFSLISGDTATAMLGTAATPERLAAEISAFAAEPSRLTAMAGAARSVGRLDAAERLADLVAKVAGI